MYKHMWFFWGGVHTWHIFKGVCDLIKRITDENDYFSWEMRLFSIMLPWLNCFLELHEWKYLLNFWLLMQSQIT